MFVFLSPVVLWEAFAWDGKEEEGKEEELGGMGEVMVRDSEREVHRDNLMGGTLAHTCKDTLVNTTKIKKLFPFHKSLYILYKHLVFLSSGGSSL